MGVSEDYSVNDHINEQVDVDVKELVQGAARVTSLETPGYESRASFTDRMGHTVNECLGPPQ